MTENEHLNKNPSEYYKDLYDNFFKKEIVSAQVVQITNFGAYLRIGTITAYIKNADYGSAQRIKDVLSINDSISVIYSGITPKGTLKVVDANKREIGENSKANNYCVGQIVSGYVVKINKSEVFVRIDEELDVLCQYKKSLNDIDTGVKVELTIKKVSDNRLRGRINKILE